MNRAISNNNNHSADFRGRVKWLKWRHVREQDICDKEIKNKKELCYNASDQTNKITGDPSYETYYNRRTETS